MIKLVTPSTRYKESYLESLKEFQQEGRDSDISVDNLNTDFDSYVNLLKGYKEGIELPEGYVPESKFWLVDGNYLIGTVSIRHYLTDLLERIGGHIGYEIRPSMRKKGYGKKILRLALNEAKALGINKALITCDETNIGSRKIIEGNGGVLENIESQGNGKPRKLRYWINLD